MARLSCSNSARRSVLAFASVVLAAIGAVQASAQAQPAGQTTSSAAGRLAEQAARAEAELRIDVAADRLSELILEHPRAPEAPEGRARLARLLALGGDLPAAMLQCQALADALAPADPVRKASVDLATTLARRLRVGGVPAYYATPAAWTPKGIPELDEPTAVVTHASGAVLVVDGGGGRAYRIEGDAVTSLGRSGDDVAAGTMLQDGSAVIFSKNGLTVGASPKPVALGATWGGRARQAKKVRALAALSNGDLLAVDRDFNGVLRCAPASGACAPWGPGGKVRTVKAGPSDLVLLLDDRQETVRVVDAAGRLQTTIGPTIGSSKIGEIGDVAFDGAYGVYLLDRDTKRVYVLALVAGLDNRLSAVPVTSLALPVDGALAVKNPSALGLTPDGALIVAGRSIARLLRYQ